MWVSCRSMSPFFQQTTPQPLHSVTLDQIQVQPSLGLHWLEEGPLCLVRVILHLVSWGGGGGGVGLGVNLGILETTEKTRSGYGFLPSPHAFFASLFTARLYLEAQNRLLSIPTYPARSSLERIGSYGKHAAASRQANIDSFCITSKFLWMLQEF